jgi:ABC-type multidrug transport system ATPase subunit
MKINLSQAGKRFNREWIFRNATIKFQQGISYAITGPNGSGKSTLLQCIAGMMQLSEGTIQYAIGNGQLANEHAYKHISFCAPYLELIEEMKLSEFLNFHFSFKNLLPGIDLKKIIALLDLDSAAQKQIRYFSSGMKQRVKLAQAIFTDTSIVLLDEPCSNFDAKGIDLYHSLIDNYCKDRLVIISSNDEIEYRFCKEKINITSFKD